MALGLSMMSNFCEFRLLNRNGRIMGYLDHERKTFDFCKFRPVNQYVRVPISMLQSILLTLCRDRRGVI